MSNKVNIWICIVMLSLTSCHQNNKIMNRKTNTDIKELNSIIILNPSPKEVQWEVEQIGRDDFMGKANYRLYAILNYENLSQEDYDKLLISEDSEKLGMFMDIREWMPKDIKQKLNDSSYINKNSFHATKFYKYPYEDGFIVRFKEKKKIVLSLLTALNQ